MDLSPDVDPYRLSSIDVKVLSLFEKYHELKNVEMAKEAGINEKTVQRVWARISKMNLIRRFAFIRNLGFDIKPWISIIGHDSITQGPIIERIIDQLRCFPFSWLFYDLGDIDMGSSPIIAGLVYLPACWVKDFFVKFNLLSNYGFSTKIDISYDRSIKWNINLSKTYAEKI
ncbi:MAG: hypothetical protein ACXADY_08705 [Candidatus Hodarchaeales archaeon]